MKIDESWYIKTPDALERYSAGGVIVRIEHRKVLIALMNDERFPGTFELPKGGIEGGENSEEAAKREISEELGLTELNMIGYLGKKERLSIHKKHWSITEYYLFSTEQADGVPTETDKHYQIHWFQFDDLPELFWPEQRQLIEENQEKIKRLM